MINKLQKLFFTIFIAAFISLTIFKYNLRYTDLENSDAAAFLYYVLEQLKQHKILLANWYGTTSYFEPITSTSFAIPFLLLNLPLWQAQFYGLFILTIILIASYYYLLIQYNLPKWIIYLSLSLFISPPFWETLDMFFGASYYSLMASYQFIAFGIIVSLTNKNSTIKSNKPYAKYIFLSLSIFLMVFSTPASSIAYFLFPLMGSYLIVFYLNKRQKNLFPTQIYIGLAIVIASVLVASASYYYAVSYIYIKPAFIVPQQHPSLLQPTQWITKLNPMVIAISQFFNLGFNDTTKLINLLFVLYLFWIMLTLIINFNRLSPRKQIILLCTIISILETIILLITTNLYPWPRYFLLPFSYFPIIIAIYLAEITKTANKTPFLLIILIICAIFISHSSVYHNKINKGSPDIYMTYTTKQKIIQFLLAQNLTHGYATYWAADALWLQSNQALTIVPLRPYGSSVISVPAVTSTPLKFGTGVSQLSLENYNGPTFLILTCWDQQSVDSQLTQNAIKIANIDGVLVYKLATKLP